MVSGCGWLLNGDAKFSAVAARKAASGLRFSCRRNTLARKTLGFPRSRRLTKETDLEAVRRTGKRMQTEHLEARALASLLLHPRIGIIVPKYRYNTVKRNRVRRRLRELARVRVLPQLGKTDLLVRAKPLAYAATFEQLASDVDVIARWAPSIAPRS